jgi:hypothetical protein
MTKCLDFIYACKEITWQKKVSQFGDPIIIFNRNNIVFQKKMREIGVKLI